MNIDDTWRSVDLQLPLSETKNDFDRVKVFLVERQVFLKFAPIQELG